MANGNGGLGASLIAWVTVFVAGVGAIFGLGRMKQQLDQHEVALGLRATKDEIAGLSRQVETLHEDVREIRTLLNNRRVS